ncbi:MAG: type II secretion system protein M [Proteobacteria bacterium]|nr:type II secretion system protein M [Pseudomonadota bacterium]
MKKLFATHPAIQWFHARQPREQKALRLLAYFLAGALLWQGAWVPARDIRNRSQSQYLAALADLEWMRAHAADAQKPASGDAEGSVLTLVAAAAKKHGVIVQHAEPAQDGSLRVTLEGVSFARLLAWLQALQAEHGIRTDYAALERGTGPGQVSANLTFRR